jgi:hypothetical protein
LKIGYHNNKTLQFFYLFQWMGLAINLPVGGTGRVKAKLIGIDRLVSKSVGIDALAEELVDIAPNRLVLLSHD